MRASTVWAGVFAAFVFAATPLLSRAVAEDLYGDDYGASYEDDRAYAGEYDDEDGDRPSHRYSGANSHPRYNSYKDDPVDTGGSIKDGYPVPMPPPPSYSDAQPAPARPLPPRRVERLACLESWQVERRLAHDGWTDIRALATRHGITRISARRIDTGRPFSLRVDRCSGDLISARPQLRMFGGHRHRPWRDHRWASDWRH